MKKSINYQLLKTLKERAFKEHESLCLEMYEKYYSMCNELLKDIIKPMSDVCIHGRNYQLMLPYLE